MELRRHRLWSGTLNEAPASVSVTLRFARGLHDAPGLGHHPFGKAAQHKLGLGEHEETCNHTLIVSPERLARGVYELQVQTVGHVNRWIIFRPAFGLSFTLVRD